MIFGKDNFLYQIWVNFSFRKQYICSLTALKSKLWKNIFSKNMKRERNHSNVTFVTKVFLKRAICQNTLLLSTILTTHSNVIFVTKFFCKEQFKETYCWHSWKEEKMWMSLCNQKISLRKTWESIAQKFMKEGQFD